MISGRFERLAQWLPEAACRRRVLSGIVGSAALAALGVSLEDALAACKPAGKKCKTGNDCCSGKCNKKKHKCVGSGSGGGGGNGCPNGETEVDGRCVLAWGKTGSSDGYFSKPAGIALDAQGNVYVADSGIHRIQKFDANGVWEATYGTNQFGNGIDQFNQPLGVAVGPNGYLYAADTNNGRIKRYNGVQVSHAGKAGSGNLEFQLPAGVGVDSQGWVYVADTYNHRIQRLTSSLGFNLKFGVNGSGNLQFERPSAVATDAQANIYVADSYNHRIQVITIANNQASFVMQWGGQGSAAGQFMYPSGVAVDATGNVYVADRDNDRIQQFTVDLNAKTAAHVATIGAEGSAIGNFNAPTGVAVDGQGRVYVADKDNNRIQRFTKK